MKPAPPVIIIFLTSGNGSNFVLPVRIGALFQTPKSSKKLPLSPLSPGATPTYQNQRRNPLSQRFATLTGVPSVGSRHDEEFELGKYVTNTLVEVVPINNNCDGSRNLQSRCRGALIFKNAKRSFAYQPSD